MVDFYIKVFKYGPNDLEFESQRKGHGTFAFSKSFRISSRPKEPPNE
jgi:hypothetical protein